jgi:(S)-ureidoglycine aminohydrolase
MTPLFGHTRSIVRGNYALLEPSGFVASPAPEWQGAKAFVVISPAMGARFTQTHFTFERKGTAWDDTIDEEHCAYVVKGTARVLLDDKPAEPAALSAGSFLYVPPATAWTIKANRGCEIVVFSRKYVPLPDVPMPKPRIGHAKDVPGQPFLGDPDARLQVLLPDEPAFDMAVNIFTYQPGATLPMVETHIMEHGLLMLSGQGVYRLGDDWHPVQAGDVIWMGPYCPQWFVAMGKEPARYLYYKDVNRSPL